MLFFIRKKVAANLIIFVNFVDNTNKIMFKKLLIISTIALVAVSCGTTSTLPVNDFPKVDQKGQTAIVAHRGFWNCEQAGFSENSIASLKAAQDNGFWGSELDVHLTADGIVMVNHDNSINGKKISEHTYADFAEDLLPNGEKRPTLDEYLVQAKKSRKTMLILELKAQPTEEKEDLLVEKTVAALKAHKLFSPDRVAFISFSKHMSEKMAVTAPKFINQYLNGELSPDQLAKLGINGFDYHYNTVMKNKGWVSTARGLGMSTNVWTVNKEDQAKDFIEMGIDAITTNEPLMIRSLLGDKEFKK